MIKTTEEVATMLECSAETVELAARQGSLPGLQFGRSWIFPEDALRQALNMQAYTAANERLSKTHPATAARAAVKPVEGKAFGPLRVVPPTLPVAPESA